MVVGGQKKGEGEGLDLEACAGSPCGDGSHGRQQGKTKVVRRMPGGSSTMKELHPNASLYRRKEPQTKYMPSSLRLTDLITCVSS